jgi:hypothetical protein
MAALTLFVLAALLLPALLLIWQWRNVREHFLRHLRVYALATPFLTIFLIFGVFALLSSPSYDFLTLTVASRGQYGDSFGVLNSLFTGMGFAGLTLTLWFQQVQFRHQSLESQAAKDNAEAARYEATLHRLMDLYKACVDELLTSIDGKTVTGRDAMRGAIEAMLKSIRIKQVNEIPPEILLRYRNDEHTEADKKILDRLFLSNATIINRSFMRQARVVNTFTLLLRHLEDEAPVTVDIAPFRALVQSQLTHIEISYFFYISLGFKEETELRRLLARSKLIEMFGNVTQLQVHRYMYKHLWNYDPKQHRFERKIPFKQMASQTRKKDKADDNEATPFIELPIKNYQTVDSAENDPSNIPH